MKTFIKLAFVLAFVLAQTIAFSQTGTIKGRILSVSGGPLAGISVGVQGTSLGAPTNESGVFTLQNVPVGTYTLAASGVGYTATRQNVTVTANKTVNLSLQLSENQTELQEVVVVSQKQAYVDTVTTLGTRTNTRLLDVPQSIQSVTRQVMMDQQNFTLNETTKNLAGVTNYAPFSYYIMRGFETNGNGSNFTTNGVRGAFYDFSQQPALYNVESIEAIRGPASALFSAGSPGGIINITTKQPKAVRGFEATASYGSFGQYRFMADATGPVGNNKKLLYRFIFGTQSADSFRDYVKGQNYFFAPSVAYLISAKTSVTAEINYMYDNINIPYDRGIVARTNTDGTYDLNAVPISWSRHNPTDKSSIRNWSAQLRFAHQFTDRVSFTSLNRITRSRILNTAHVSYGAPTPSDSITDRIFEDYLGNYKSFTSNNFITVRANTGTIRHTIVAGFDIGSLSYPNTYLVSTAPSISVRNPSTALDNPCAYQVLSGSSYTLSDIGIVAGGYVQDQIEFTPQLKAVLGLRYDTYHYTTNVSNPITAPEQEFVTKATKWLPRVGLVYQPMNNLSFYGSYSESFNPNASSQSAPVGGPFDPEGANQIEFGVKSELMRQLTLTAAVYQLNKVNVLTRDPTDVAGRRQISTGAARSRGLELTAQGNVATRLTVIANYALNETVVTKSTETNTIGNVFPMAAPHMGSVWLKYALDRYLGGLGVAAGVQFISERKLDITNQNLTIPGFTAYEAALNYRLNRVSVGLNVYNLANTRNFMGGYGLGVLWTNPPRSFRLSVTYRL